jgi:branched-chain amino acid aminotransferase
VHIRLTLTRGVKITSGMDPRLNQRGPTLIVLAEHKPPVYAKTGLTLITSKMRRPPPEILDPRIHHANLLNSILAKIEANNAGADDALMLDTRGFVAETNATHVFTVRACRILTPRVVACPEGITRATVLEICDANGIPHEERDLTIDEFYNADEMFCTGTMGELAGVIKLDGRTIGGGEIGPMTRRLSALFAERTAAEGTVLVN